MACRGCVVSKCAIVYLKCANVCRGRPGARAMRRCGCTPRGTTARPGARLHAAEGREAGAGYAEGMCRGARGWRRPRGEAAQMGGERGGQGALLLGWGALLPGSAVIGERCGRGALRSGSAAVGERCGRGALQLGSAAVGEKVVLG